MASEPIDTSERPSMISVQCVTDTCGQWLVVAEEFTGLPLCSVCLRARVYDTGSLTISPDGGTDEQPAALTSYPKPAHWFSANNPPPAPPVYPPSAAEAYAIRVNDPDVSGRCLAHPIDSADGDLRLMTLDPDDITVAFAVHDHMHHNRSGGPWLIAGNTGRTGDVCNACAGAKYDSEQGKTVAMEGGPRHDLCLRGRSRGRGNDCPCTHDKPWMRGIKPGDRDRPGAVQRTRELLEQHRPDPQPATPAKPVIITGYLFDPEGDDDENT